MKLLWLDLETTGPDPQRHDILEVAWAVADLTKPFDIGPVRTHAVSGLWTNLSPFALDTHTRNGLLADCRNSAVQLYMIESVMLDDVPHGLLEDESTVLAGDSVHFDLGFIRRHMPVLADQLSHRVYDVSAVKLFARSLGMPDFKVESGHRAADDVRASIAKALRLAAWLNAPTDHSRRMIDAAEVIP